MAGPGADVRFFLIFLALVCAGIAAYRYGFVQPQTFRFKATIVVQTPEGEKSGSSVIETTWWRDFDPLGGTSWFNEARGVAPMVDLGEHGTIVAAMNPVRSRVAGAPVADWPVVDFPDDRPPVFVKSKRRPIAHRLPLFVLVSEGEVTPLTELAPRKVSLPLSFGDGFRLVGFLVEPSNATLRVEIENAPDWLVAMREKYRPPVKITIKRDNRFEIDLNDIESHFPPRI